MSIGQPKQCMLVMQAAYGKSALAATSFFTYVGLGLGFLASTLSLPFGVFVLLCQREPVRYIQVLHSFSNGSSHGKCLPHAVSSVLFR